MNTQAYILPVDSEAFSPVLQLSSNFPHPKERNGRPVQYWEKQLLKPGLKLKDRNGVPVDITRDYIVELARNQLQAKKDGFEPPLPFKSHDVKTADNLGWLVDVEVKPDGSLWGTHQFIGTDAEVRDIVAKYKSSLSTIGQFDDGAGHTYSKLIDHNAILVNPRINLADFVPAIAASRGQAIDVVELSLAAPTTEVQMDLSKLRTRLGAAKDVPDEKLVDMAEEKLGELATLTAAKTEAEGKVTSLSRDLEDTKLELSRAGEKKQPSAEQLHYLSELLTLSRDEAARVVGPEYVTKASKQFLGDEIFDTGGLTLAREPKPDDAKIADGMRRFIDACRLAKFAKIPQVKREKGIELARQSTENASDLLDAKKDNQQDEVADPEEVKRLREMAHLPEKKSA